MSTQIETEHLRLIACDPAILSTAIAGNEPLERYLNVTVPAHWTEFGHRALTTSLHKLTSDETELGWWTYFPIHKSDNTLIGTCGYKGKPANGRVEIGYEITKTYRNKGLATELVSALVRTAFVNNGVSTVEAHTLGETNASTRVLAKCGFTIVAELTDETHGSLWRWVLQRPR